MPALSKANQFFGNSVRDDGPVSAKADVFADESTLKEIIAQSGPDALAGVSSSRSINEDSYQMQKLFRAVIGTNNIDNCART